VASVIVHDADIEHLVPWAREMWEIADDDHAREWLKTMTRKSVELLLRRKADGWRPRLSNDPGGEG
jgi:uncharacterized tellurite resistance protein B-like protein